MTILGVIAAIMITTLKPSRFQAEPLLNLKQKTYSALDGAIQNILQDCTKDLNLYNTYHSCKRSEGLAREVVSNQDIFLSILPLYIRGSVGACADNNVVGVDLTQANSIKLKNGVCLYISGYTSIFVDVNGNEGPNGPSDQFRISINPQDGVASDMPKSAITTFACNIEGCSECSGSTCTKCYCGYALINAECLRTSDWASPGCNATGVDPDGTFYTDNNCTIPLNKKIFCRTCRTSVASSVQLYKITSGTCKASSNSSVTCTAPAECTPM